MATPQTLGALFGIFEWWTLLMMAGVAGLVIFLVLYRRRQM